jgi:hypothetical protein
MFDFELIGADLQGFKNLVGLMLSIIGADLQGYGNLDCTAL